MLRMIDGTWPSSQHRLSSSASKSTAATELLQIIWKYRLPNTEKLPFQQKHRFQSTQTTQSSLQISTFLLFPPKATIRCSHQRTRKSLTRHSIRSSSFASSRWSSLVAAWPCLPLWWCPWVPFWRHAVHPGMSFGFCDLLSCVVIDGQQISWHWTSHGHVWPILAEREILSGGWCNCYSLESTVLDIYIYVYIIATTSSLGLVSGALVVAIWKGHWVGCQSFRIHHPLCEISKFVWPASILGALPFHWFPISFTVGLSISVWFGECRGFLRLLRLNIWYRGRKLTEKLRFDYWASDSSTLHFAHIMSETTSQTMIIYVYSRAPQFATT